MTAERKNDERERAATELIKPDSPRILIRPDGYIAYIGSTHFSEYAPSRNPQPARNSWTRRQPRSPRSVSEAEPAEHQYTVLF